MDIKLEGMEEIHRALKELSGPGASRARVNASRAAARVIAKNLKRHAPVRRTGGTKRRLWGTTEPGDLKRSIRSSKPFNGRSVSIAPIKMEFWGHILNTGVDSRRGISFPQRGWISASVDTSSQAALDKFSEIIWKNIRKQWAKR